MYVNIWHVVADTRVPLELDLCSIWGNDNRLFEGVIYNPVSFLLKPRNGEEVPDTLLVQPHLPCTISALLAYNGRTCITVFMSYHMSISDIINKLLDDT